MANKISNISLIMGFCSFLAGCGPNIQYVDIINKIPRVICEKVIIVNDPLNKDFNSKNLNEIIIQYNESLNICYNTRLEQDKYLDNIQNNNSK